MQLTFTIIIYSLVQPDFVWVSAKLLIFCFCFLKKKVGTFQYTLQNPTYGVGSQSGVIRGLWHLQTHSHSMCETTLCIYCASSYLQLLDTTDRMWIYTHSKSEGSKIKWRANEEVRNQVFHCEKCKSWEWHMVGHTACVATYGHRMQGVTWRVLILKKK